MELEDERDSLRELAEALKAERVELAALRVRVDELERGLQDAEGERDALRAETKPLVRIPACVTEVGGSRGRRPGANLTVRGTSVLLLLNEDEARALGPMIYEDIDILLLRRPAPDNDGEGL